jgi:hypothetical protein
LCLALPWTLFHDRRKAGEEEGKSNLFLRGTIFLWITCG